MYTYIFMKSVRVIPVSAVLSRVPYECLDLQKWVTPPLFGPAPRSVCLRVPGRDSDHSSLTVRGCCGPWFAQLYAVAAMFHGTEFQFGAF